MAHIPKLWHTFVCRRLIRPFYPQAITFSTSSASPKEYGKQRPPVIIFNHENKRRHSCSRTTISSAVTRIHPGAGACACCLRADEDTQALYNALAEKRREGRLTPMEQEELESMVWANTLLGLLKAEAQFMLGCAKLA